MPEGQATVIELSGQLGDSYVLYHTALTQRPLGLLSDKTNQLLSLLTLLLLSLWQKSLEKRGK